MKAKVTYDADAEPTGFKVTDRYSGGQSVTFTMDGSTAVATSVEPEAGEMSVYFDDLSVVLEYAETLPFVQAVTLDEYESEECGDE